MMMNKNVLLLFSVVTTTALFCDGFVPRHAAFVPKRLTIAAATEEKEFDLGSEVASLHSHLEERSEVASLFAKAAKSMAKSSSETFTKAVADLTGKDKYEFGDLTKWVDQKARDAANEWTEKEQASWADVYAKLDAQYEDAISEIKSKEEWAKMTDMSKVVGDEADAVLKEIIGSDEYNLEDITEAVNKELVDIVKSKEFSFDEAFFLLRVLTSFGLGMNPAVLAIFPLNLLVQMYNYSLLQEAGSRVTAAVALEMDKRAKAVLMDRAKTEFLGEGEGVELFQNAIRKYTGEEEFSFGDISRRLQESLEKGEEVEVIGAAADDDAKPQEIEPTLEKELEAIDAVIME